MKKPLTIFVMILSCLALSYSVVCNPVISDVQISRVFSDTALITWTTDVPATSRVTYGKTTPPTINEDITEMTVEHSVLLTQLDSCSTYYFEVTSNDGEGPTTDSNNGNYYTFLTGHSELTASYNASDVPLVVPMNGSASSYITVTDNMTIEDIDVTIGELLKEYVWTLRIYLIAPDNTRILLAKDQGFDTSLELNNLEETILDDEAFYYMQDPDIHPPYTGRFKPLGQLKHLYGKNAQGVWELEITNIDTLRTATLNSWSIKFSYGYQHCAAHSKIKSYQIVDTCTGTGNGNDNGVIDSGEYIQLPITLYNDGNVDLTSVYGTLTTSTSGVSIVNGSSSFPNIAKRAEGTSLSNFSFDVDVSKSCGDILSFNLHISSSQNPSGWNLPLTLKVGEEPPENVELINEDFTFGMPATWTIVDGGDNDDAPESVWTWTDQNPCSGGINTWREIMPPVSEPYMMVDSDCAEEWAIQDEQLILPQLDFSAAGEAFLEFDQDFLMVSDLQVCYVDIRSSLTSNEWVNVWIQQGVYPDYPPIRDHINLNITSYAAGANNVEIRFRYYDPEWGFWWVIDNIKVYYTPSYYCTMNRCCPSMTSPVITNISDDDLCSQSGITITFTTSTPATRHDLYVDDVLTLSNVTSPISYNPGDKSQHDYKIRAINYYEECYIESTASNFTDEDRTPGTPEAPTVQDLTPCQTAGVTISWGAVSQATYYDLLVDGTTIVNNVTSPYTYEPNDNNSHTYKIRGRNDDCTGEWSLETTGTDENHTPETPSTAPTVSDIDPCQTNGVNITWGTISGANGYDLRVDGTTIVENVTSPYTYFPNDNVQHSYEIRGKYVNSTPSYTCYGGWSPSQNGTDINDTPGQATITNITDNDACATTGITITYTSGTGATSHDLYKDGSLAVSNFVSGSTYQPGDNTSHSYVIRAKKNTCYTDSIAVSGTDVNDTPGAPTITSVVDISACATSGVQVNYTSGSGATSHDLYKDGLLAVSNYVSGSTYSPGDNSSHTYVIRAKKNTCYTDSAPVAGTDVNDTPGAPTITSAVDIDPCATNGVQINYTPGSGATSHDLYKDGALAVSNYVSGSTYQPGDNSSHTYVVRAKKASCYNDSTGVSGTDVNNTPGPPSITSIIDNDPCATTGITINYTPGSGALVHDLWKDGSLAQANFASGSTYNPGDNSQHTYIIRGKRGTCYTDSAGVAGTDAHIFPSTPSILSVADKNACALSGVTISWGVAENATSYDIAMDNTGNIVGNTSSLSYDFSPGDPNSHFYYVRGKNASCTGDWSTAVAGVDANDTPGQPTITNITDNDGCSTSGITITYAQGSGATSHDLYKDGSLAVINFLSGDTYSPGDSSSHTYVIRAKKGICYYDSTGVSGTDVNNTPGAPTITSIIDDNACQQSGIYIYYTAGSGGIVHDLYKDGVLAVGGYVSGTLYNPGDSLSHSYFIRAKRATCYTDSASQDYADINDSVGAPSITNIVDENVCAQSGIRVYYTPGSGANIHSLWKDGVKVVNNYSSGALYNPGDTSSHSYVVRAEKGVCYNNSTAQNFTDANNSVGTPTISSVVDVDPCATSGVSITWGAVSGATGYDLRVDSATIVTNVTSPYTYSPGDNASHNYEVRAKNATCTGSWSTAVAGTDANGTPSAPVITSIVDIDPNNLTGIQVNYTAGAPATQHDLYKDGILAVSNYISGATYLPGDSLTHSYVVRAINGSCYTDSVAVQGTDAMSVTPPPEIATGTNYTWPTANQTTQVMGWNTEPLATGYRVYRGVKINLGFLCDVNTDFCTRYDGTSTQLDVTADDPATIDATNRVVYYLITGYNGGGEGPAGNTTSCGARQVNTTGNCP